MTSLDVVSIFARTAFERSRKSRSDDSMRDASARARSGVEVSRSRDRTEPYTAFDDPETLRGGGGGGRTTKMSGAIS
jgi:hypothetical protein